MGKGSIRSAALWIAWLWVSMGTIACSSCRKTSSSNDTASAPPPPDLPSVPLLSGWTWTPEPGLGFSLPKGCQLTTRPVRHVEATRQTLFLTSPGDLNSLAVVVANDVGVVTGRGVILAQGADGGSAVHDIPWSQLDHPPVMASAAGKWIAVVEQADPFLPMVRLWLWRENIGLQSLAEGDHLHAVDARCDADRCVLLTTKPAKVATSGGTAWMGRWDAPASSFERVDIPPPAQGEGAHPVAVGRFDAGRSDATVVMGTASQLWFVSTKAPDAVRALAIDGPMLDVGMGDLPMAVWSRGKPDDSGCVPGGASLAVGVEGKPPAIFPTHAVAATGYARMLPKGALVAWVSAVDCRTPGRKIVHAVVVDAQGQPLTSPMAVGDSDGFALNTQGNDVNMYLRDGRGVVWLRAKCAAGGT